MADDTAGMFRDALYQTLKDYPTPENIGPGTDFETAHSEHPLYQLVVDEAGKAIESLVDTEKYTIKASVGRGSPTYIPYIAVMHTDETTSPQRGRYVVYLFDPVDRTLYLTLNQGAKEAREIASDSDHKPAEILRIRAETMAEDIDLDGFSNTRIKFEPSGKKGILYGAGTVCYKSYSLEVFPDADTIVDDLQRLLDVYDEVIAEPLPEVPSDTDATEYGGIDEALEDIDNRLANAATDHRWLKDQLGEALIVSWSEALEGYRPSDTITTSTATTFDQLRAIYNTLEPSLEGKADELGVGELGNFSAAKTLFLGWVRLLQEEVDGSGAPLTQPRLNSILRETYTVSNTRSEQTTAADTDHPLVDHIQSNSPTVYKFSAPPDYWLTTYAYAALGLEEENSEQWAELQAGDVILFHSTTSPSWRELDDQEAGLLGGGIVRTTTKRSEDTSWWYDERSNRPKANTFPHLVTFERLYATGELDAIDFSRDIFSKDSTEANADLEALTSGVLPFTRVNEICEDTTGTGFPRHRTIEELDAPENQEQAVALTAAVADTLQQVPPIALHKSFEGTLDADAILEGLYFPGGQGEEIIAQIQGALRSGKHTILTGPPGTGKTEIARRVGEYLATEYPYLYSDAQMTTATSDWSTFDTVGGYMPEEGTGEDETADHLTFTPGLILNRFKTREGNTQRNESLVIDELNRADIDKAFGQLFTVLSGHAVQLPYTRDNVEIELAPADQNSILAGHEYRIPESWSLFATLNTYDKTSLYEMSYAFMRRFSFIRVPAPDLEEVSDAELHQLLERYTDAWQIQTTDFGVAADVDPLIDIGHVWQAANGAIDDRAIGPAVVKDILQYLVETPEIEWERRLSQAVISYIFPQLEGVPKRDRVVQSIADVGQIDEQLLDTAARDMLQVPAIQETDE